MQNNQKYKTDLKSANESKFWLFLLKNNRTANILKTNILTLKEGKILNFMAHQKTAKKSSVYPKPLNKFGITRSKNWLIEKTANRNKNFSFTAKIQNAKMMQRFSGKRGK